MTRYFSMPEEALRLPASEFKTYAVLRRMAECPAVDSLSREAEAVGLGLPLPLSAQGEAVGLLPVSDICRRDDAFADFVRDCADLKADGLSQYGAGYGTEAATVLSRARDCARRILALSYVSSLPLAAVAGGAVRSRPTRYATGAS